jgi:hypothetical protein
VIHNLCVKELYCSYYLHTPETWNLFIWQWLPESRVTRFLHYSMPTCRHPAYQNCNTCHITDFLLAGGEVSNQWRPQSGRKVICILSIPLPESGIKLLPNCPKKSHYGNSFLQCDSSFFHSAL